jgi:hypothetical protein
VPFGSLRGAYPDFHPVNALIVSQRDILHSLGCDSVARREFAALDEANWCGCRGYQPSPAPGCIWVQVYLFDRVMGTTIPLTQTGTKAHY